MPRMLRPEGPIAQEIANIWWLMFFISVIVFIGVMVTLFLAVRRRPSAGAPSASRTSMSMVVVGGVIIPAVVILVLMAATVNGMVKTSHASTEAAGVAEVIGYDWWWEFRYPEAGFVTANELHVPVGQPLHLKITSADVIHSFWVPALSGKLDAMPDFDAETWIQADRAGAFRGQCAEFCGLQHAKMAFLVVADEPDQYQAWLARQQQPAPEPTTEAATRGRQVFLSSPCIACHAVRGTSAAGRLGPDLTHLAGRRELGAGTLPNTPGNLAGWILNSQEIKPGNLMPNMPMQPDDLQALLAYMQTLQ